MGLPRTIFVITGMSGAGKTTLGKRIAQEQGIPFLSKDGILESFYDEGRLLSDGSNRAELRELTFQTLWEQVYDAFSTVNQVVLEGNFNDKEGHGQEILKVAERCDAGLVQVYLYVDPVVAFSQFAAREHKKERHPVHTSAKTLKEFNDKYVTGRAFILNLGAFPLVEIDANNREELGSTRQLADIYAAAKRL